MGFVHSDIHIDHDHIDNPQLIAAHPTVRTSRLPLQFGSAPQSRSKSTTSGRSLIAAQWRGVTLVVVMIDMKRMTIVLVGDVDKYDEGPHPRIVCSYARACVLFQQLSHPEMFILDRNVASV